jgi:ankyrin repeat protein
MDSVEHGLHKAVLDNDILLVNDILANNDRTNYFRLGTLHFAIENDYNEIAKKLIKKDFVEIYHVCEAHGGTIAYDTGYYDKSIYIEEDINGHTPLHLAVMKKNYELIELLIDSEYGLNSQDNKLRTPFHLAIENNILSEIFELECDFDPVDFNLRDHTGNTVLHYTIDKEDLDSLEYLIEHDLNFTIRNKLGFTPLHIAVLVGNLSIVKMVYNHYEELFIKNANNETVLETAKCMAELMDKQIKESPDTNVYADIYKYLYSSLCLFHYIDYDIDKLIEIIENENIDVNVKYRNGPSILYIAALRNDYELVEFLIDNNADINTRYLQKPLLSYLAENGEMEMFSYLIDHGADINYDDTFSYIIKTGDIECIKYCLEHGALINNTVGTLNRMKLLFAESKEVINLLISYGADINIEDTFGNTLLHKAVYEHNIPLIEVLVENNVILKQDKENKTPIDYAKILEKFCERTKCDMVNILMRIYQDPTRYIHCLFNDIIMECSICHDIKDSLIVSCHSCVDGNYHQSCLEAWGHYKCAICDVHFD